MLSTVSKIPNSIPNLRKSAAIDAELSALSHMTRLNAEE